MNSLSQKNALLQIKSKPYLVWRLELIPKALNPPHTKYYLALNKYYTRHTKPESDLFLNIRNL